MATVEGVLERIRPQIAEADFDLVSRLRGANPFDFLTAIQRPARAAAQSPADWLPWTYRETLARLTQTKPAAPVPMLPRQ